MIEEIRRDLPNTPIEIIVDWLSDFVGRAGWPPTQENTWGAILGKPRDLAYLRNLTWEKTHIQIRPGCFEENDFNRVLEMIRGHVFGEHTLYSLFMSDGAERIKRCSEFLETNGVFPKPIILELSENGRFHILDGHHRLCAFLYLYGYITVSDPKVPCTTVKEFQEVWIARKDSGRTEIL
ncbi:MAG: ParB N-terminal domain-containing protein [Bdellovibrionota bacterium]